MCFFFYIAIDQEIDEIPFLPSRPGYNVTRCQRRDVASLFTKKYVYRIGSGDGCSCGFHFGCIEEELDEINKIEDIEARSLVENSAREALEQTSTMRKMVESLVREGGVEFFAHFDNNTKVFVAERRNINIGTFMSMNIFDEENTFFVIE